ncbi:MAG: hypothetical protein IKN71_01775 [Alphaproteobacteria bacterium]|nr:hypothetical protein [Alphaproteobacteria bacterium]
MVEFEKSQNTKVRDELVYKAEMMKVRPNRHWKTNFGMIASLGGVIILPILLGIWCGGYLDSVIPQRFSWRLSLLFVGFAWGVFNAYMWIKIENDKIAEMDTKSVEIKKEIKK